MAAPGAGIYVRGARSPCTPPQPAPALEYVALHRALQSRQLLSVTVHRRKLFLGAYARIPEVVMMRTSGLAARFHHARLLLLLAAVLLLAATADGIRPGPDDADARPAVQRARPGHAPGAAAAAEEEEDGSGFLQEEVYGTGSSLPDCTHACGACKPCNRVMVSFKCSIAEPCPMVYRCMCKGKCYPVPSS